MSSPPELVEGAFALFLFPSFRYFGFSIICGFLLSELKASE